MSSRTLFAFLFILPFLAFYQSPHSHKMAAVALDIASSHDSMQNGSKGAVVVGAGVMAEELCLLCTSVTKKEKLSWRQFH